MNIDNSILTLKREIISQIKKKDLPLIIQSSDATVKVYLEGDKLLTKSNYPPRIVDLIRDAEEHTVENLIFLLFSKSS